MIETFQQIPWSYRALILASVFIVFAAVGVVITRRLVSLKTLRGHHDVAGFVFANIGVLYAVLLGFTVVNVQQRFDKIKLNAQTEATYLAQLYLGAAVFPEKNRQQMDISLINYATSVIDEEWVYMEVGESSPQTEQRLLDIWQAYYDYEPETFKERAWYSQSTEQLNQLTQSRLARLHESKTSLGREMWLLLILGALIMVTFMWFFGLESATSQILMASILAASTAFLLFLVYTLDTVFSGEVSVSPDAMREVIKTFIRTPLMPSAASADSL